MTTVWCFTLAGMFWVPILSLLALYFVLIRTVFGFENQIVWIWGMIWVVGNAHWEPDRIPWKNPAPQGSLSLTSNQSGRSSAGLLLLSGERNFRCQYYLLCCLHGWWYFICCSLWSGQSIWERVLSCTNCCYRSWNSVRIGEKYSVPVQACKHAGMQAQAACTSTLCLHGWTQNHGSRVGYQEDSRAVWDKVA